MDDIDNEPTHNAVSSDEKISENYKDPLTPNNKTDNEKHRHCVSLPLYYDQVT